MDIVQKVNKHKLIVFYFLIVVLYMLTLLQAYLLKMAIKIYSVGNKTIFYISTFYKKMLTFLL